MFWYAERNCFPHSTTIGLDLSLILTPADYSKIISMRLNIIYFLRSGKPFNRSHRFSCNSHQQKLSLLPLVESVIFKRHFGTTKQLYKFVPDKSKVPKLNEAEIEEQFVTGSGPGGQNVNRLQNCVLLRHIPTGLLFNLFNGLFLLSFLYLGIIARCHEDRLQQRNRILARQLLIDRLDQHFNGDDSVAEQKKRYILSRKVDREQKASELRSLKKQYQESIKQKRTIDTSLSDSSASEEDTTNLKN